MFLFAYSQVVSFNFFVGASIAVIAGFIGIIADGRSKGFDRTFGEVDHFSILLCAFVILGALVATFSSFLISALLAFEKESCLLGLGQFVILLRFIISVFNRHIRFNVLPLCSLRLVAVNGGDIRISDIHRPRALLDKVVKE